MTFFFPLAATDVLLSKKKYRRLSSRETLITELISDKDRVLKLEKVVNLICSNLQLTEKTPVRTITLLKRAD